MSALVLRIRQRTVTQARLMPWSSEGPRIWFRYADGYEAVSNAKVKTPDVKSAIGLLSTEDQARLALQLGELYAIAL